jgi:uncharacterized protein YceK
MIRDSAIVAALCLLFALAILSGCGEVRPLASTPPGSPVQAPAVATAESRLREAQEALRQAKAEVRAATDALADERTNAAQAKVYWFAGILGVLALAGAAVAIFVPSVAKWALRLSLAAAATAALAVFAAWMLPYLWWIGAAVTLASVVGAIVYWRLDVKSRDQVVQAVDGIKYKLPGYKEHFRQVIDTDAEKAIDAARKRLGLA